MKLKLIMLLILLLFMMSCQVCKVLDSCGDFTFTGTIFDTSSSNGIDMDLRFDFDPGICNSTCACATVCYIQIVRTAALDDGTYLYPSTEKKNRATAYGWYIDRLENRIWGYYGRNDDGNFASTLIPGSESTDTILYDSPRRPESDPWLQIWWEAVSVPVCIEDKSGCVNNMLGYYFWSWIVDDAGKVTGIIDTDAWEPLEKSVDDAVSEWNADAPGLGKNTFPAFTRLK